MTLHRWPVRRLVAAVCTLMAWGMAQAQLPTPPAPTEPLTVEEAVQFALQHNPTITFNAQNVQIARDQVRVAEANRLPTLSLNANGTYTPGNEPIEFEGMKIGGDKFASSAQATISQPVWPINRWRAPIQAARANVGLNEESLQRIRQQVVAQTRESFFQLLTAQELQQVAEYSVQVAQTQLRLATATFEAGTAPRLDVEQARASLADAEVGLVQAQNRVDLSRAALATQLGLPAGTPITITAPTGLPSVPDTADPLVAQALQARPEIVQLRYRRQQIEANIAQIRLETLPLVNAQAAYNQTISGGSLFGSDGLSFSVAVAFTAYNGGRTRAEVAAARTQLAQVTTSQQQLELGITLDVRQAWLNVQNALRQLTAAEQQRVAAEEALRIAELRYENGEGILLEVGQARLRSTQARTALAQARFLAQVAESQLQFAIGTAVPATPTVTGATAPAAPAAPAAGQ